MFLLTRISRVFLMKDTVITYLVEHVLFTLYAEAIMKIKSTSVLYKLIIAEFKDNLWNNMCCSSGWLFGRTCSHIDAGKTSFAQLTLSLFLYRCHTFRQGSPTVFFGNVYLPKKGFELLYVNMRRTSAWVRPRWHTQHVSWLQDIE